MYLYTIFLFVHNLEYILYVHVVHIVHNINCVLGFSPTQKVFLSLYFILCLFLSKFLHNPPTLSGVCVWAS